MEYKKEYTEKSKEIFIKKEAKHASYYLVIGLLATFIDLGIFSLLNVYFGINAVLANTCSVSLAIVFGFFGNQKYNFKINDNLLKRFFSYASVSISGLVVGNFLIYFMHNIYGYNALVVKIISLPVIIGSQYILNRFISFNNKTFKKQ